MYLSLTCLSSIDIYRWGNHPILPQVAAIIRDLYKDDATKDAVKRETEEEEENTPKTPVISPEELAEIKAEFIGMENRCLFYVIVGWL